MNDKRAISNEAITVVQVKVDKLKPAEYNPRKWSENAVSDLKASISTFGLVDPIIANSAPERQNVVIGGHFRLHVAKMMGYTEVPVVYVNIPDVKKEMELNVRLNKNSGEWDYDLLANFDEDILKAAGFDSAELDKVFQIETDPEDDDVPEAPAVPRSKVGDIYQLGNHRVMCGDSTKREDVDRLMDGKCADCVFTSPPYAVGVDYGEYKDTIANLREMLPKLSAIWKQIIVDGGFAVINYGDVVSAKNITGIKEPCEYPMALDYWPIFRNDGWVLWSRRIWCKPNPRVHSLQCIGSNRAATDWEHIWTWKKTGNAIVKRVDGKSPNGWIDTTKDVGVEVGKNIHGAGMATSIAERMVLIHSRHGNIVFEPFCGTGTTTIACEKTSRICYGMELDPKYVDVIVERWEKFTGKKAKKAA